MRILALWLVIATCAWGQVLDGSTRADWPHYGGSQAAWRYSALNQINTSNVKNLAPAWIFQTGDTSDGLHSTPIVRDGVMYIITPRNQVYVIGWKSRYMAASLPVAPYLSSNRTRESSGRLTPDEYQSSSCRDRSAEIVAASFRALR